MSRHPQLLLASTGIACLLAVSVVWAQAPNAAAAPAQGNAAPSATGATASPATAVDSIEPRVTTSSSARPASTRPAAGGAARTSAAPARNANRANADRIELENTQITGNRELPKVLYIVPWKRPELGDLVGKPLNSLLDEVLAPVDREVFRRENRYFDALQSAPGQNSTPTPAAKPSATGDESAPKTGAPPDGGNAPSGTSQPEPKG